MNDKKFAELSRREFLRRAACAAVGTAAMTSAISDLRLMNAAVAQSNIVSYVANTTNFSYTLPIPTQAQMRDRVRAVVHLIASSPDCIIQK